MTCGLSGTLGFMGFMAPIGMMLMLGFWAVVVVGGVLLYRNYRSWSGGWREDEQLPSPGDRSEWDDARS
jgi:hypothetical protein